MSTAADCLIKLGTTPADRCPYLSGRLASLAFYQPIFASATEFDGLLAAGYRRHGLLFYRPRCPGGCRECVPIRVPVGEFRPSKSQRRVRRRGDARFAVSIGPPRFEPAHLDLFNRHARSVSPDAAPLDRDGYIEFTLESPVRTRQVEFRIDGALVGIGILDVGRAAASSMYFAWDPEFAADSPGTYSALWEIDWCRAHGVTYYYLGYWVADCPSMSYKSSFRPNELMAWKGAVWRSAERNGVGRRPDAPDTTLETTRIPWEPPPS